MRKIYIDTATGVEEVNKVKDVDVTFSGALMVKYEGGTLIYNSTQWELVTVEENADA